MSDFPRLNWRHLGSVDRREAAAILGVSTHSIDKLRRDGMLRDTRLGRRVIIPTHELRRILGEVPDDNIRLSQQPDLTPRGGEILKEALERASR